MMIKGINHQVIEVTQTDNKYYERALLVVRPEYSSVQRALLEKEAKKLLKKMGAVSAVNSKKANVLKWLRLLISACVGALCTAIIYNVCV